MSAGSSDLIEYFKLNVRFDATDSRFTIETIETADRAQGLRQVRVERIWRQIKIIGQGGFGKVWVESDLKDPTKCRAVKEISKANGTSMSAMDYTRELVAMGRLSKHLGAFVDFYGWYETDFSVYLAMEYFDHGDLGNFLHLGLTERDAQIIGKQLLEGLVILHNESWAHRDLKPKNIFVVRPSPDWWVKIGDFGISKRLREDETRTSIGTQDYAAPEVQDILPPEHGGDTDSENETEAGKRKYSVDVDMWSLGCVLFQILTNTLPFPNKTQLKKYCRQRRLFPVEDLQSHSVSREGCGFIEQLMKAQPSQRPTAKAALVGKWIATADDYDTTIGVKRAQSQKAKPAMAPSTVPTASQSSVPSPPAYSEITAKAPAAPVRSSSDDATARLKALHLDEQPSSSSRHQSSSNPTLSSKKITPSGSGSPLPSQDLVVIPNNERNREPIRRSDRSAPRTATVPRHDYDPKLGVALWSFVKVEPDDLDFRQYEIISKIEKTKESWWHGTNEAGASGYFPSNRIGQNHLQATALHDFTAQNPTDISLEKGARIRGISIASPGWWIGRNHLGKRGHFPGNFVKLDLEAIRKDLNLDRPVSNGESRPSVSPPGLDLRRESTSDHPSSREAPSGYVVGRANRDYKAPDGTMAFQRKELITEIEELPSGDFLLGTSPSLQRGKFPHDAVDVCSEVTWSKSGWCYDDILLARARMPTADVPMNRVKARALQAYRKYGPHELSFPAGGTLEGIERSTPTWWHGWFNGTKGIFPSHTVQILSFDDELNDEEKWNGEATARPVRGQPSTRQGLLGRIMGR